MISKIGVVHPAESLLWETECFLNLKQRFCSREKIDDSGKNIQKKKHPVGESFYVKRYPNVNGL